MTMQTNQIQRRKNRDTITRREPSIIKPPRIGTYWQGQGGIYCGIMPGENGAPDYHLICADERGEFSANLADSDDYQLGALSVSDGLANTLALCASHINCPAAQLTRAICIDSKTDFYLPAKNEAMLCYIAAAHLFKKFEYYFTSTQNARTTDYAFAQDFNYGSQENLRKSNECRARAVRRILITD